MNKQEEEYLKALYKERSEMADMLERPSARGIQRTVVEKYSDQAHFIYELLQNADDAGATKARFILEDKRLIFAHNGFRHFSISDPKKEAEDTDNKKIGDINAICSIGNSSKTNSSIGKFGVGFKAVFQYTQTPHIYDKNFRFKIERLFVPVILTEDFPGRKAEETLFVFPFDHKERDSSKAYSEILEKLRNLLFPLLFLKNLKDVEFEYKDIIGLYGKKIEEIIRFGNTVAEHLILTQNNTDNKFYDEDLYLFSRYDECGNKYSVGFFMDAEGHLRSVNKTAFCFFPTKETTNLNFILHAPFLLTDSREGIRAGVEHNDKMITLLAELAADALEYLRDIGIRKGIRLIDDNIVRIIPVDKTVFTEPSDKSRISFLPFYEKIKKKFKERSIIPATNDYVMARNAYWASVPQLASLFDNTQLGEITENKNAQWVFTTFGRDETRRSNQSLFRYIEDIVRTYLNEDAIINGRNTFINRIENTITESIKGIKADFIEKQELSWLHKFYKWLSEAKRRIDFVKNKPIFLNQDRKAVSAFNEKNQLILFLPIKNSSGYTVVNEELLNDEDTAEFIKSIGIKEPSLKDQIYNIILPQYKKGGTIGDDSDFITIFEYYRKCPAQDLNEFVKTIKEYEFLQYYQKNEKQMFRGKAESIYLPTPELLDYFETAKDIKFVALDKYKALIPSGLEQQLIDFLIKIGVKNSPSIIYKKIDSGRSDLPRYNGRGLTYEEPEIEGLMEILEYIEKNKDEKKSKLLWNILLDIIKNRCIVLETMDSLLSGKARYFYYSSKCNNYPSLTTQYLKNKKWLIDIDGNFADTGNISIESLSPVYDKKSEIAKHLIDYLEIKEKDFHEEYVNLTPEQREKIEFADKLKELGISEEDLEEFKEFKRRKEAHKDFESKQRISSEQNLHTNISGDGTNANEIEDFFSNDEIDEETFFSKETTKISKATANVIKDIARRTEERKNTSLSSQSIIETNEDEAEEDEYMPSSVDYSRKIELAKEKSAAEIDKITHFEELQKRACSAKKYSYVWFKTLLEMEIINSNEANSRNRQVSISFSKVEKEPGTKRTLILRHPNQHIPQFIEELADIPLVFHIGDQTKTVAIEVANIQSYTLRVKIKNSESIDDIDLSTVAMSTIDVKRPIFLLEELRNQFMEFKYSDDYNMQTNLCKNIEFVFGPPGTGKTTHLAKNVLLPFMKNNKECKILVLTPTNKSADVLVKRIMEISGNDTSYNDWLVRFGTTGDEEIEQNPVFRDKTFDIRTLHKNVTITTIARFPYDFFMPPGKRIFLYEMKWDYIVIDEASMISLVNIILPLYKKTPEKFIIAGDPFQIEPTTSVNLWKNENIYTMVHLDSFVNPETIPHKYKVELLTTQYRSIPEIGDVFSNFAYGGVLRHNRASESQRSLNIGNNLGIKTLNVIKFPVSEYESIYRCKKLQHSSSYQVYSAIFTFEYVSYLSHKIADNNPGKIFKIGIVAPYRAQADMIDKLLSYDHLPKEIDVQVGTIHGFQGDECDIIFAVFNTPPAISSNKEMFLNKKNIINVSISRARDYLFVIMPDDETENIDNLILVKEVEGLIKKSDSWKETNTSDLEKLMFGESKYLENNAFSTSHQSVNVYGLPEKIYEIRTEENAVDVQIHRSANTALSIVQKNISEKINHNAIEDLNSDENLIPIKLRKNAIVLSVIGDLEGKYYLISFDGKLRNYTDKKTVNMFIPVILNGKGKNISVYIVEEDRIIYITSDIFRRYYKETIQNRRVVIKRLC